MAWNGTGVFQRVRNWVDDATAGIKIRADYHDAEDDNLATGISNCIARDGQSTILNNIPFNGKRITGLADPVNPQDAATMNSSVDRAGDSMTGDLVLTGGAVSAARFQLWPDITKFFIYDDDTSLVFHSGVGIGKYGFSFVGGVPVTGWASIGPTGMHVFGAISSSSAAALALQSKLMPGSEYADGDGPDILALVAALLARIEALESRGT